MNWYQACVHPDGHFWMNHVCVECGVMRPMPEPSPQEEPMKHIEPRASAEVVVDDIIIINNTDAPLPWITVRRPKNSDTEVTFWISDNDEDKTIIEVTGYTEVRATPL